MKDKINLIPAFKGEIGDWDYYLCKMKLYELADNVKFAYELEKSNPDIENLLQRGINVERSKKISEYLLKSEHRFLNTIIVAVWKGDPSYIPLNLDYPDDPEINNMFQKIGDNFGCLKFDGTQEYFALDGQHRLKAIKDIVQNQHDSENYENVINEDISVIIVGHFDDIEGKIRTRRLFSNLNKNAKPTSPTENIIIDQDDSFAIITRRFIEKYILFERNKNLVRIFSSYDDDGDYRFAAISISPKDKKTFTTVRVLYDCIRKLGFNLSPELNVSYKKPDENLIEESFEILAQRYSELLKSCGNLYSKLESETNMEMLRSPIDFPNKGNALMRPLIQRALCDVIEKKIKKEPKEQREELWKSILGILKTMEWGIGDFPWKIVYNNTDYTMISSKDHADLLKKVLTYIFEKDKNENNLIQLKKEYIGLLKDEINWEMKI